MSAVLFTLPREKRGSTLAKLYPMWGKGAPIIFWAQGGRVHIRDERPDADPHRRFTSVHWREMAHRVLMFSQMVVTHASDGPEQGRLWGHERRRAQKWIYEMEDVLRESREQSSVKDEGPAIEYKKIPRARASSGDVDLERYNLADKPVKKKLILPN
jgi:hypothetical protein